MISQNILEGTWGAPLPHPLCIYELKREMHNLKVNDFTSLMSDEMSRLKRRSRDVVQNETSKSRRDVVQNETSFKTRRRNQDETSFKTRRRSKRDVIQKETSFKTIEDSRARIRQK